MTIRKSQSINLLLAMLCWIGASVAVPAGATSLSYLPGNFYSTQYFDTNIKEYSGTGELLNTLELSGLNADEETKGLVFGPDGRMYIVLDDLYTSARLAAIDPSGAVVSSYVLPNPTGGNLSYGKLKFVDDHHVLVGTQGGLIQIDIRDEASAKKIYSGSVYDIDQLPNGNLIVIDGNRVWELKPDGSLVRQIVLSDSQNISQSPFFHYNDLRGLEYDPATNYLYMSMLGNSGNLFFKTMIFDYSLQDLIDIGTFRYGDDIFLLDNKTLLLGSRTDSPWILAPANLSEVGRFEGEERMFVTGIRTASTVAVTPTSSLLGLAFIGIWASRFRRNIYRLRRWNCTQLKRIE